MKQKPWYQFRAQADPALAEIYILGIIAAQDMWGDSLVTPKQFVKDLAALDESVKTIRVHINSPGGDAYAGVAIANALRDQTAKGRIVETVVDGLAASAATVVMMAGSTISVADNAMVVVHNPYTIAIGDSVEMRKTADGLDRVRDSIVATYQWHSKLTADELVALMQAETWMDADEAIANGFATAKVEGLRAAASLDPALLDPKHLEHLAKLHVPERFAARLDEMLTQAKSELPAPAPLAPEPAATLIDVFPAVRAAGLDMEFAAALVDSRTPRAEVPARVSAEKGRRTAEATRQADIKALCAKAKLDAIAPDLIAGGITFDAARSLVGQMTAAMDKVEIDAGLAPAGSTGGAKSVIDFTAIYAARNKRA